MVMVPGVSASHFHAARNCTFLALDCQSLTGQASRRMCRKRMGKLERHDITLFCRKRWLDFFPLAFDKSTYFFFSVVAWILCSEVGMQCRPHLISNLQISCRGPGKTTCRAGLDMVRVSSYLAMKTLKKTGRGSVGFEKEATQRSSDPKSTREEVAQERNGWDRISVDLSGTFFAAGYKLLHFEPIPVFPVFTFCVRLLRNSQPPYLPQSKSGELNQFWTCWWSEDSDIGSKCISLVGHFVGITQCSTGSSAQVRWLMTSIVLIINHYHHDFGRNNPLSSINDQY